MSEAEYSLCKNCCLTLGSLKAGSLFTCPDACRRHIRACLGKFRERGIRFAEMNEFGGKRLFYVYNAAMTEALLRDAERAEFLESRGYDCASLHSAVAELRARIRRGGEFPHEIGVFLGYALDDVKAFIADPAGGELIAGYWKVYSDVPAKKKLFGAYRSYCENVFGKLVSGQPLLTLFQ